MGLDYHKRWFKDLYTGLEAQAAIWDYMKLQVKHFGKNMVIKHLQNY